MRWEQVATAALAVLGGLGVSAWLNYLDYKRRDPHEAPERPSRPGDRLLSVGLGLLALALAVDRVAGAEREWLAIACYLPAAVGIVLVAAYVTRLLSSGPGGTRGSPGEKD